MCEGKLELISYSDTSSERERGEHRQVSASDLKVEGLLRERFIFGVQQSDGLGLGAQTVLLARESVFRIIHGAASKQNETIFHELVLNREPVRSLRVSA